MILKVRNVVNGSVQSLMFSKIGYIQGKTIGTQADSTKWWLFAMCTGIPQITGILSVIPKFLYPLTKEKRERMYNELLERRHNAMSSMGVTE